MTLLDTNTDPRCAGWPMRVEVFGFKDGGYILHLAIRITVTGLPPEEWRF